MLKIHALHKDYGNKIIFRDFNLNINSGEFVAILGPNGTGKTTLLRLLSNLTSIDKGEITFREKAIRDYRVSYIFQNYEESLFPWLSVFDNITLPLKLQGLKKNQRKKILEEFCMKYKINLPLKVYPYQLSGGQKQVAVIAQSLISKPDILLMDEPFSSLDYIISQQIQEKLIEAWQISKISVLFVSHRLEEAILLSSRIIVLNPNPSIIILDIKNNLPYPRNSNSLKENLYIKLYERIEKAVSKAKIDSFLTERV